jgi:UDP-N-acetylglucosamine--N-acetylmuramyl-(pentapeptide) pyrophosphoryl-undecaprenol N-acetylglucosamine transferase
MNRISPHIVFAGGGTAGHLFPGLAVAAELSALRLAPRITFAGSGKPFEAAAVKEAGFEYLPLRCAPAAGGPRKLFRFIAENWSGYRQAKQFIRKNDVSIVVGLGGYASVPMTRAAVAAGVPLVLLEQNAYPGKVTRWLAQRAELICSAFGEVQEHLQTSAPIRVTGNPVRAGFRPRSKKKNAATCRKQRLIVLGGSGGAHSLNEQVPRALYKLREQLSDWEIVHQTGPRDVAATQDLYRKYLIDAAVVPFIKNLPQVLRASEFAISRAGGTTLAELANTKVPALLLPYPHAANDHQRLNAEVFVRAGAAEMVDERNNIGRLDDAVAEMLALTLGDAAKRRAMSKAIGKLAHLDAGWQVAIMIHDLATRKSLPSAA